MYVSISRKTEGLIYRANEYSILAPPPLLMHRYVADVRRGTPTREVFSDFTRTAGDVATWMYS